MRRIDAANLNRGLVGAWCPSVPGSGLLLPDLSGYGNHGTLTNMDASDWVGTARGRALDFDGVDDYVDIGNKLNFERTDAFSIAAWIRVKSFPPFAAIATKMDSTLTANGRGYFFSYEQTGQLGFILRNVISPAQNRIYVQTQNAALSLNIYTHVCLTYNGTSDASGVLMYADGTSRSTNSVQNNLTGTTITTQGLAIGGRPSLPDAFANAQIPDIRIYNRALSPSEIKQLYEGGPGYGLRLERKRTRFQVQGFNAGRFRRQQLIGTGVY